MSLPNRGFLKAVWIDPEFTDEQLLRRLKRFIYLHMQTQGPRENYNPGRLTEDYLNSYDLHAEESYEQSQS